MAGFLLSADAADSPSTTRERAALAIDCAALDPESRGALEARARAEIALTPQPAGAVVVICRDRDAEVEWVPAGPGPTRQRVVALEATAPEVAVDRLLDAVHELRLGGDMAPAPPSPGPALVATSVNIDDVAAAPPPRGVGLGAIAAMRGELWQGAIPGGIAAELGLRLAGRGEWSLTVAGAVGRGAETARAIRAETLGARVAVQHPIAGGLELALGGEWRRLQTTRTGAGTLEEHDGNTFGGFAALRYVVSRGHYSFAAGPDLTVLAAPIAVNVGTDELFRIPRLCAGVSVSGAADLFR